MESKQVTIDLFREVFLSTIAPDGKYFNYISSKDFTERVKLAMVKLGVAGSAKYVAEYYKVDYSFWDDKSGEEAKSETVAKVKMKGWKWKLLALIEHENNSNDWNYEVLKLAPFKCPLRIVIGYRNEKVSDADRLRYVEGLLADMKDCFCEDGEFWIVIGNCGHGAAGYKFYQYVKGTTAGAGHFE